MARSARSPYDRWGERIGGVIFTAIVVVFFAAQMTWVWLRIQRLGATGLEAAHPAAWSAGEEMARLRIQEQPAEMTFRGWTDRQRDAFVKDALMAAPENMLPLNLDSLHAFRLSMESGHTFGLSFRKTLSEAVDRER